MSKNIFKYDDEKGEVTCILSNKDGVEFFGVAHCHPDDMDMYSHLTGENIAVIRAEIKVFQHYISTFINPELRTLNSLYNNLKGHPKFNPSSFESIFIKKRIYQLQKQKKNFKDCIKANKDELRTYIKAKDSVYQAIRKQRKAKTE